MKQEEWPTTAARRRSDVVEVGDFAVSRSDKEKAEAKFSKRSSRSRALDKSFRGPIASDYETWAESPRRFDFPGVDTPTASPSRSAQDYPTPTGRRKMSSGELSPSRGDVGISDAGSSGQNLREEFDASLDSLADAISSPFTDD